MIDKTDHDDLQSCVTTVLDEQGELHEGESWGEAARRLERRRPWLAQLLRRAMARQAELAALAA